MIGIYIHIPFCRRKCPYCDFYSVPADEQLRESYVKALCKNIERYKGAAVFADTIYFGGGTPSILTAAQLGRIISACDDAFLLRSPEITAECNPCTVDYQKLCDFKSVGVNRISLGIQSAQDDELGFLGRLHTFSGAKKAVLDAYRAGFENISGDVMLGLGGQTMQSLENTLESLCEMPLVHISAYMLKIEEGTPFDCEGVKKAAADEDTVSDMYLKTAEILGKHGFEQYEISNFAKNKMYSRHNLKYWQCGEYLGFGAAAHSFFGGRRFFCEPDIKRYIQGFPQSEIIAEANPDPLEEYIMLGLRLKWGIKIDKIALLAGESTAQRLYDTAKGSRYSGLCVAENGKIRLTEKGFLLSNSIISDFISLV